LLVFGVFSEHALIVLNFFGFDEGCYPFCSGVIILIGAALLQRGGEVDK